jgi:alkaline phosphatase D
MKKLFSLLLACISLGVIAQSVKEPSILAGPMNGYSEHTEVLVWVQTKCAKTISIEYQLKGTKGPALVQTETNLGKDLCRPLVTKFILSGLEMGKTYAYDIFLDGKRIALPYSTEISTKVLWEWRTPPPNFTFMLGSCLYINDSAYDRPGRPYGQQTSILKSMTETPSDFMLWLGDNVYLREADYSSRSGIEYRYRHTRSLPELQPLLAKRNNYAIWDDHDFGDNDANKNFEFKDLTYALFKEYWGNKTYGEEGRGIYSNFRFSDAEFFLCDDRFFRDESDMDELFFPKTQLGSVQLSWLKNKLKHSKASFKFVAIGGQFINENTDKESYNFYKKEREEIIKFISEQKISGVIFLSGDRHHTELLKNEKVTESLGYPLYDLTSSSITAGASNAATTPEKDNPQRIPGTLVAENNYCTIAISGPKRGERTLLITCFDVKGLVKWGYSIKEAELKALKP